MLDHPKTIVVIDRKKVPIDNDLVDIIKALNKKSIKTTSCCQGGCANRCNRKHVRTKKLDYKTYISIDGKRKLVEVMTSRIPKACRESCYITFSGCEDAEKFMNLVYRDSDSDLIKDKIKGCGSNSWSWKMYWDNDTTELYSIVVFPRSFLPLVGKRIYE